MGLNRWMVAAVIGASLVATIGLGIAAALGSGDAAPDRAIVERIGNGNTLRWMATSPAQVQQLYRDTVGLPDAPTGVYACPAIGSVYQYRVTFLAGSDVVLVATFDPGGCRIVDLRPGGSRQAEGSARDRFWGDLALAMGIHVDPAPMIPHPSPIPPIGRDGIRRRTARAAVMNAARAAPFRRPSMAPG